MSYRDDDDAARARADALQRDLDEAQDELAATKEKLVAAEAEKVRLAEQVAHQLPAPPTVSVPEGEAPVPSDGHAIIVATVGFIVLLVAVIALRRCANADDEGPPNPLCTLRTNPPGARIVSICHNRVVEQLDVKLRTEQHLGLPISSTFSMQQGVTPLTKSRLEWIAIGVTCGGRMIARLDGYADTPVSEPLAGMGCTDTTVEMERLISSPTEPSAP